VAKHKIERLLLRFANTSSCFSVMWWWTAVVSHSDWCVTKRMYFQCRRISGACKNVSK